MEKTYEVLVLRPGPHRPDEFLMLHALKASIFHPPLKIQARTCLDVSVTGGFDEFIVDLLAGMLLSQRTVGGDPSEIHIDELGPAAGFGMPKYGWERFCCVEEGILTRSIADAALASHGSRCPSIDSG